MSDCYIRNGKSRISYLNIDTLIAHRKAEAHKCNQYHR